MGARFHAQERSQRPLLPQERKPLGRPRDADDEYRSLVVVVVLRVVVGERQQNENCAGGWVGGGELVCAVRVSFSSPS